MLIITLSKYMIAARLPSPMSDRRKSDMLVICLVFSIRRIDVDPGSALTVLFAVFAKPPAHLKQCYNDGPGALLGTELIFSRCQLH